MAVLQCPTCGKSFGVDESGCPPFCSERCWQIDLGRWLGEHYSIPAPRESFSEDEDPESED